MSTLPLTLTGALSAARTALDAASAEAAVSTQNIANASTPLYAREQVDLTTSPNDSGVAISNIERLVTPTIRSSLLSAQGQQSGASESSQILSQVQALFGEPSNGLSTQLTGFWNAWQQVANSPSDPGARDALVSATTQMTTQFNTVADGLTALQQSLVPAIGQQIDQVNSLAQQVASLNGQITSGVAGGQNVNSLEDQRDQLVSQLAELVGAAPTALPTGQPTVVVNGQPLVVGQTVYALQAATTSTSVSVTWAANGQAVNLTGGQLGAEIQAVTSQIPTVQGQLNAVAAGVIQAVNTQSQAGYTLDTPPVTGVAFFQGTGAGDIAINPAIAANTNEIAASASGSPNDGANAQLIANLATAAGASGSTLMQQYNALVVQVGTMLATANQGQTTANNQVTSFEQLDQSVSGVSTSDEQTALLLDESQSQAASAVLQAVQAMLNGLLTAVGV